MIPLKIEDTIFKVTPKIMKKELSFRRAKVKDEKILLIAKESEDSSEIFSAIVQFVNNCAIDPAFDGSKINLIDLEYIFLQIRGQSVSNIINISIIDNEDGNEYKFNIDIPSIDVHIDIKPDIIFFSETSGVKMKPPSGEIYLDKNFINQDKDRYQRFIVKCIDSLFDGENAYPAQLYTEEDLLGWLDNLDIPNFQKIEEYVNNLPTFEYKIKYKNSLGNDKEITLSTLSDFFTLQ